MQRTYSYEYCVHALTCIQSSMQTKIYLSTLIVYILTCTYSCTYFCTAKHTQQISLSLCGDCTGGWGAAQYAAQYGMHPPFAPPYGLHMQPTPALAISQPSVAASATKVLPTPMSAPAPAVKPSAEAATVVPSAGSVGVATEPTTPPPILEPTYTIKKVGVYNTMRLCAAMCV